MKKFNRKGISVIMLYLLVLSMFITGCSSDDKKADTGSESGQEVSESKDDKVKEENVEFEDDSYIVDNDWLKENLDNQELLILDARGEEAYNKEHISGAIAVSWQQFSNMEGKPGDENWGTVLEEKELSEKLSEVGITDDKKIVVYSDTQKGWGDDARIVWMLRRAGMEKAVILDGGINYWKSQGNEVSKEAVQPKPSNVLVSSLDSKTNIKTEELSEKLGQVKIIDTRTKKEYNGATDYGEPRGGHIPGAINIDFMEFLSEDGTLKKPSEIKTILDDNGIKKDDEIVTYCTAGIRSAHMQIVLDMMGYNNAKNYDQSFNGWAGVEELEVQK